MGDVNNQRRYYLLSAAGLAGDIDSEALQAVWWGKQEAIAGTALPPDFPFLTKLAAAHYTKVEDLAGADQEELMIQGLTYFEAKAVLDAFAEI